MSKERAHRRAEREREAGHPARRPCRRAGTTANVAVPGSGGSGPRSASWAAAATGQPSGTLARRQRSRTRLLVLALLVANVLLWFVRPDWEARLAAAVLSVLAFPVLRLFLVSRR